MSNLSRRSPVWAVLGLLSLSACAPEPPPFAGSESAIAAGPTWETTVSGAGVGLLLSGAGGEPLLRLACARGPARMTVVAERFRAIGSEERLTLGLDGRAFVFVADPTAERPTGVEAEGPILAELLDTVERARAVSVSYGAQTLGPHMPPGPAAARRFVSACRQVADAQN